MNIEAIKSHMIDSGMITNGDHVLVAVSAGPDSMCLLHVLTALKSHSFASLELSVIHVNHHTRPGENEQEASVVQTYCDDHHIPFYVVDYYDDGQRNFHEQAREFRYKTFQTYAKRIGANKVALAHHLDDQIETVLFRMIRGSNIIGYSGMEATIRLVSGITIIRPFLTHTKKEILAYCERYKVPYCIDSSNVLTHYTRNKLRLNVIPELEAIQRDAVQKIEQLRIQLHEVGRFINEAAETYYYQFVRSDDDSIWFSISDLKSIPTAILRIVLTKTMNEISMEQIDVSFVKINALMDHIHNSKPNITMDLGKGYQAIKAYDQLIFKAEETTQNSYHLEIKEFKEYILPNGIKLTVKIVQEKLKINSNRLILCYNNSMWPLAVRSPKPGDRIQTKIGHKKLNRIFINRKIPQHKRSLWPVLTDQNDRILWVIGLEKTSELYDCDPQEGYIVIEVN